MVGPHLPYAELYPYIDSIWYGEQCNYAAYTPEQWLAEVSGVPFGLPGQVLGDNAEQWQALVFGMTCRIYPDPHRCNPRPLWAALDALGLQSPRMIGWWEGDTPLTVANVVVGGGGRSAMTSAPVRATLFVDPTRKSFAIAVANWAPHAVTFTLSFDWTALRALGFPPASSARLSAPAIPGFQPAATWQTGAQISVRGKRSGFNEGWLIRLHAD